MPDPTKVNAQVTDSIAAGQLATMSAQVVRTGGAGKAYQSVAQSTALAIQDAVDNLRNVSQLSATAFGAALAQTLATGEAEPYKDVMTHAQEIMNQAVENFSTVGSKAAQILHDFPNS